MALFSRIIGWPLLTAGLGAGLGFILFGQNSYSTGVSLLLACAGSIVGAIAGAGHEIAMALRQET